MKDLYLKIHDIFSDSTTKSQFTDVGLKPIRSIDLYAGQDFNPDLFEAKVFPALFIGWDINYDSKSTVATLNVRLAYEQLRDTSNIGTNKATGLKFLDTVRLTDDILKSIQTDSIGKITLTSEGLDLQPTVVDVYKLNYECSYSGASRNAKPQNLKGNIDQIDLSQRLKSML